MEQKKEQVASEKKIEEEEKQLHEFLNSHKRDKNQDEDHDEGGESGESVSN